MTSGHAWWQRAVLYQIYPRSFQDSNGDGVGDLPGILSRLDYLEGLGVDALWLSPIHPSPMADFGYDVADYRDVDPVFGTLADFDRLVAEAHRRGLKVILDYVPNHTSDRHPWFKEARSGRGSRRRDWYVWHDASPGGGPPNNWVSEFGGSAWTWDEATQQYYYHAFLAAQPDLNWRNPEVRAAMHDVLRFWLDRGVNGFRVDAVHHLIKDDHFRDNPPNPKHDASMPPFRRLERRYTVDQPEVHEAIAGMRRVIDAYPDRVLIGEAYLPIDRLMLYYGAGGSGFHLPFNFHLIGAAWTARSIAAIVARYDAALPPGAWPNWVLGNHDNRRLASRIGQSQARVAAMILLTLRGTPTLYYGDEIGMEDVAIPPDCILDPLERNLPGYGLGRDPERAPLPWSAGPSAGFTDGSPWLPLPTDRATRNVAAAAASPSSLLSLYRTLLTLRRAEPALVIGAYAAVEASARIFAYLRTLGGRRLLVIANMTLAPTAFDLGRCDGRGRILVSTALDRAGDEIAGRVALRGDEGLIVALPEG